jgi:hypothetical protein
VRETGARRRETVHREAEFDASSGWVNTSIDASPICLRIRPVVSGCAATNRDTEPAQHIGCGGVRFEVFTWLAGQQPASEYDGDGPQARRSARPACPDSRPDINHHAMGTPAHSVPGREVVSRRDRLAGLRYAVHQGDLVVRTEHDRRRVAGALWCSVDEYAERLAIGGAQPADVVG